MSRLAKKAIIIPDKAKVEVVNHLLKVRGPLGELTQTIPACLKVKLENNSIFVTRENDDKKAKSLQGLMWVLIRNMLTGVMQGFKKELEIRGLGYQAQIVADKLVLRLGTTHPIEYKIPAGVNISIDKGTVIVISGIDKQLVGETAAQIRRIKPPEPYKGFGIRYADEYVIKKAGKAVVGVTAAVKK